MLTSTEQGDPPGRDLHMPRASQPLLDNGQRRMQKKKSKCTTNTYNHSRPSDSGSLYIPINLCTIYAAWYRSYKREVIKGRVNTATNGE